MSQQRKNMQDYLLIWIDAVCLVISYIAACFLASVFRKFIFDFSSVLSSLWMILISPPLFFGISVVQHESLFHEAKQI